MVRKSALCKALENALKDKERLIEERNKVSEKVLRCKFDIDWHQDKFDTLNSIKQGFITIDNAPWLEKKNKKYINEHMDFLSIVLEEKGRYLRSLTDYIREIDDDLEMIATFFDKHKNKK